MLIIIRELNPKDLFKMSFIFVDNFLISTPKLTMLITLYVMNIVIGLLLTW